MLCKICLFAPYSYVPVHFILTLRIMLLNIVSPFIGRMRDFRSIEQIKYSVVPLPSSKKSKSCHDTFILLLT